MVKGKGGENLEIVDPATLEQRLREIHRIGDILAGFDQEDLKELDLFRPDWKAYFMLKAKQASERSSCLSRPTGAIIVRDHRIIAVGYNGALPGVTECMADGHCYRRISGIKEGNEDKYEKCKSSHAELNAISFASKYGISLDGCEMYTTLYPCSNCSKNIKLAGIKKVYYELGYESGNAERDKEWKKELEEEYGIPSEKIALTDSDKLKALEIIINTTSSRRLKPTG